MPDAIEIPCLCQLIFLLYIPNIFTLIIMIVHNKQLEWACQSNGKGCWNHNKKNTGLRINPVPQEAG